MEKDPDGGPFDAYPNGKSWDKFGKKFYHNTPQLIDDEYNVAIVTPSIHYCMGGLEISVKGEVENEAGGIIPGLYAAGEIAGGVHGNNRLGGSSLLDRGVRPRHGPQLRRLDVRQGRQVPHVPEGGVNLTKSTRAVHFAALLRC